MADDSAEFLIGTGQEAGHVYKSKKRNIEGIAGSDKSGRFIRCIDVKTSGQNLRLVGNNTHYFAVESGKTGDHVFGIILQIFIILPVVNDFPDDFEHIVGLIGIVGNKGVKFWDQPVGIVGRFHFGRKLLEV
ncbi:hypothetical protein SDC9_186395 [bioreactor metagenome]|uniref:Uncharacterized protein n=1 Tax=bioreactor metagenome TaxID=1076179 RepID=A0A645HJF1_9ZZZZ